MKIALYRQSEPCGFDATIYMPRLYLARWPNLAHGPSFARWPSTLLPRWLIVELASSINIPQWHLKYTHVELEIKTKLTKAGENYVASTIRTMRVWCHNLCALWLIRCKKIDLFSTTSYESQKILYNTTGILPYTKNVPRYKHVSRSLEIFFACTLSTFARLYIMLPPRHPRSAGSLAKIIVCFFFSL